MQHSTMKGLLTLLVISRLLMGKALLGLERNQQQPEATSLINPVKNYSWNKRSSYYFTNLHHKMEELLAFSPNTECDSKYVMLPDATMKVPLVHSNASFLASSFPVSKDLVDWWRAMHRPSSMRVDPYLCEVVYTKAKPIFKAKQCQIPTMMHPSAPRCQVTYLKWICEAAQRPLNDSALNPFVVPEADHATTEVPPDPYLVIAKDVFVSMCGQLHTKCGLLHTSANCRATGFRWKAKKFGQNCPFSLLEQPHIKEKLPKLPGDFQCEPQGFPYDSSGVTAIPRVFVVAEVDDTHVYHIHLEIMPRLVYHLPFLLANPDIMILVGCDQDPKKRTTQAGLEQGRRFMRPFMDLVGLSMDRLIIHQNIYAQTAYLPMEGACQDPVYNTWTILHMRRLFMHKLGLESTMPPYPRRPSSAADKKGRGSASSSTSVVTSPSAVSSSSSSPPLMLVLRRSSTSKHTRNKHDLVRQWTDEFTARLLGDFQRTFPSYTVREFSDQNNTLMQCIGCQIQTVAPADVLIGVHGAGLANMLYMRPNSVVVELVPYGNDGRCLLGGGPFSRAAAVMSHNYLMHIPPKSEFSFNTKSNTADFNTSRFAGHVHSFLTSIGRV